MKQESVTKYIFRITLTLLLIAAMVAAAMALVNKITKPIIARNAEEKVQQAISLVLPGGYDSQITDYDDPSGIVSRVFKGQSGYAVEVQPVGFDSALTMMVGVAPDGSVLQICVVSHTETKGLGEVAASSSSAGVSSAGSSCTSSFLTGLTRSSRLTPRYIATAADTKTEE